MTAGEGSSPRTHYHNLNRAAVQGSTPTATSFIQSSVNELQSLSATAADSL